MTPTRLRLAIIAGAVLLSLIWYWWWSSASVQVDRTFAQLKRSIESGSASGVMDQIHSGYDFKAAFPSRFDGGDVASSISDGGIRFFVLRGLTGLFQIQEADPFVFDYNIINITNAEDGNIAVTVSITLRTKSGASPLTFTPPLTGQTFILKRDGWSPALYIFSHKPFQVNF